MSHLTADTLRRMRDNLDMPEPKPLQHTYIKDIIDPPMPKVRRRNSSERMFTYCDLYNVYACSGMCDATVQEDLRVDMEAHKRKLARLAEDRSKMTNLMASLNKYKQLNTLDQKELVTVSLVSVSISFGLCCV